MYNPFLFLPYLKFLLQDSLQKSAQLNIQTRTVPPVACYSTYKQTSIPKKFLSFSIYDLKVFVKYFAIQFPQVF